MSEKVKKVTYCGKVRELVVAGKNKEEIIAELKVCFPNVEEKRLVAKLTSTIKYVSQQPKTEV